MERILYGSCKPCAKYRNDEDPEQIWLWEKSSEERKKEKNNLKIRNAIAAINMGIFSPQIFDNEI